MPGIGFLIVALALGVDPRAVVKAPAIIPAGGTVLLDARESVSDAGRPLAWDVVEPTDAAPLIVLDQGGRSGILALLPVDPGVSEYIVAVTASVVDIEKHTVATDTAVLRLRSSTPPLPTPPTPLPTPPTPLPTPPTPGPTPTPPLPPPATEGERIGRTFAPVLGSTYADAWEAAATALETGRTVSECQAILQKTWHDSRVREFTRY